jgi:hypothetical protein
MLADLKASGVAKHRGSKGTVREASLLTNYLHKYLPRNVIAEHSGEVIAVTGEVSGQCDILILDPAAPPLWDAEDYRIVPNECVYGVIEVKSYLTSEELKKSQRNIANLKRMPKTAFHERRRFSWTRTAYGRTWDYVPTSGIVFAYDGVDLGTACEAFAEVADENEEHPELQTDAVFVLSKGSIVWVDPVIERVNMSAEPGNGFMPIDATPEQVLMQLTAHLHEHYSTAFTPGFRIRDYFGEAPMGKFRSRYWRPGRPA